MAVSVRSRGGDQTTPLTHPAHVAGDRIVTVIAGKPLNVTLPTLDAGMVLVGSGASGSVANAQDAGSVFWAAFAKDATSAAETTPTLTWPGTAANTWTWVTLVFNPGAGGTWKDPIAANAGWIRGIADAVAAAPLTGTAADFGGPPTSGDAIAGWGVFPTDSVGLDGGGSTSMTCPGLSGGSVSGMTRTLTANGLDSGQMTYAWTGFGGTATGPVTASINGSFGTAGTGAIVLAAMRLGALELPSDARLSALVAEVAVEAIPPNARLSALLAEVAVQAPAAYVYVKDAAGHQVKVWADGALRDVRIAGP